MYNAHVHAHTLKLTYPNQQASESSCPGGYQGTVFDYNSCWFGPPTTATATATATVRKNLLGRLSQSYPVVKRESSCDCSALHMHVFIHAKYLHTSVSQGSVNSTSYICKTTCTHAFEVH